MKEFFQVEWLAQDWRGAKILHVALRAKDRVEAA
jgi:hypothetical protein